MIQDSSAANEINTLRETVVKFRPIHWNYSLGGWSFTRWKRGFIFSACDPSNDGSNRKDRQTDQWKIEWKLITNWLPADSHLIVPLADCQLTGNCLATRTADCLDIDFPLRVSQLQTVLMSAAFYVVGTSTCFPTEQTRWQTFLRVRTLVRGAWFIHSSHQRDSSGGAFHLSSRFRLLGGSFDFVRVAVVCKGKHGKI